jgi:hypothetical protein
LRLMAWTGANHRRDDVAAPLAGEGKDWPARGMMSYDIVRDQPGHCFDSPQQNRFVPSAVAEFFIIHQAIHHITKIKLRIKKPRLRSDQLIRFSTRGR